MNYIGYLFLKNKSNFCSFETPYIYFYKLGNEEPILLEEKKEATSNKSKNSN